MAHIMACKTTQVFIQMLLTYLLNMCEKVKIRSYLSRKWKAGENLSVTMTVVGSLQHLAVISQFQKSHSFIQKSVFIMPYKVMWFLQSTCKAEFITHNWHEPHCIPFQIFLPEYKLPNTSGHKTNGSVFTMPLGWIWGYCHETKAQ